MKYFDSHAHYYDERFSEELNMGVDIAQQTVLPDETGAIALTADDIIELEGDFNYDGFQVVRREFFAHTFEPSITLNNYKCRHEFF